MRLQTKLNRLEQRHYELELMKQMRKQQDIDGIMRGIAILAGTLLGCMIMALIMGGYL